MKKRNGMILAAIVILVAVGAVLVYLRPVHYQGSETVCTLSGEAAQVEFDVTFYKHLWKSEKMKGKIVIGSKEYVSATGDYSDTVVFLPVPRDTSSSNHILLDRQGEGLECFRLIQVIGEGEIYDYYGPAATGAEAESVLNHILN